MPTFFITDKVALLERIMFFLVLIQWFWSTLIVWKFLGLGPNFHIWAFGAQTHKNRHNLSLQHDWNVIEGSLEAYWRGNLKTSIIFKKCKKLWVWGFSYTFNEIFPNSTNFTLFSPKREIFDFSTYNIFYIIYLLLFLLLQDFLKKIVYFSI